MPFGKEYPKGQTIEGASLTQCRDAQMKGIGTSAVRYSWTNAVIDDEVPCCPYRRASHLPVSSIRSRVGVGGHQKHSCFGCLDAIAGRTSRRAPPIAEVRHPLENGPAPGRR